jgi:hypothetical protein
MDRDSSFAQLLGETAVDDVVANSNTIVTAREEPQIGSIEAQDHARIESHDVALVPADVYTPERDPSHQADLTIGCAHHPGVGCQLLYSCCNTAYDCARCHKMECLSSDRARVPCAQICRSCHHQQSQFSISCAQCHTTFASFACSACAVLSNKETIFHCSQGCGCRCVHVALSLSELV